MPPLSLQDVAALAVAALVTIVLFRAFIGSALESTPSGAKTFFKVVVGIGFAIVLLNALSVSLTGKRLDTGQGYYSGQNYATQQQYYPNPNYQPNYQRYYAGPRN